MVECGSLQDVWSPRGWSGVIFASIVLASKLAPDLQSHDQARLGSAGASVTHLARLSGGDEFRRSVPTDVPAQVSEGTVELAVDKELTRLTALERPGGVLSLIIPLRNHVCAQAQDQVERRGPNSEVWERERRSEAGRVKEVMQTWPHGLPALRPFPDADAPISCSGNAARLTTERG